MEKGFVDRRRKAKKGTKGMKEKGSESKEGSREVSTSSCLKTLWTLESTF